MRSFSGGFYSDGIAIVRQNCFPCNNGTYVPPERAPGKSVLHCIVCPTGKIITYLKAKLALFGCTLMSRYARNQEKIRQRGSLPAVALGICQIQLNYIHRCHENGCLVPAFFAKLENSTWRPEWNSRLFEKNGFRSKKIGLSCPKLRSWRQILQFLVNLTA